MVILSIVTGGYVERYNYTPKYYCISIQYIKTCLKHSNSTMTILTIKAAFSLSYIALSPPAILTISQQSPQKKRQFDHKN